MYTKEQASQLRQAFWTAFGQYISPHPSAEGLKVNWSNYQTGIKHVYFRMKADNKSASIAIELTHPDTDIQELFLNSLKSLRICCILVWESNGNGYYTPRMKMEKLSAGFTKK